MFTGRLSRTRYWQFLATIFGIQTGTLILAVALGIIIATIVEPALWASKDVVFLILLAVVPMAVIVHFVLIGLPLTIISLGIQVRRAHDFGSNGSLVFAVLALSIITNIAMFITHNEGIISIVANVIGLAILGVFIWIGVIESDPEANKYGESIDTRSFWNAFIGKKGCRSYASCVIPTYSLKYCKFVHSVAYC
ncbi:MAG: hypothetical protein AB203_01400 [Parcubacteria bacterium C7867-008]|nr:MAG: hypothetical protein AB203_01400 [Parcubacteria bacterium C7867-008]